MSEARMPSPTADRRYPAGQLVGRLLALAWRFRGDCLLAVGLSLAVLLLGLIGLQLLGTVIDVIRHALDPAHRAPVDPLGWVVPADWTAVQVVTALSGAIVVQALLRAVLTYQYNMTTARLTQGKIVPGLRNRELHDNLVLLFSETMRGMQTVKGFAANRASPLTGAGKSSLLSLIPRFYDPVQGRIRVDGEDIRDLDLDAHRRQIGIVPQESFLFSNTVAANIAFGNPHATPERIEQAARIASAHDFIVALPQGYETVLGESGADLSGGQRQRLALARALLLQPPILILDDPTASVDPKTEHEIVSALRQAMAGRTAFVVAHRLCLLRRADRILVLDRGRLRHLATHEELLHAPGPYRDAALLQLMDLGEPEARPA